MKQNYGKFQNYCKILLKQFKEFNTEGYISLEKRTFYIFLSESTT